MLIRCGATPSSIARSDVAPAEGVDERVDAAVGRLADPLGLPVTVGNRHDVVAAQPVVVLLARQPDHPRSGAPRELHGDRANPARGGRDHDRLAGLRSDRLNRRIGGEPHHEQRARHLPRDRCRLGRQLILRDRHQLGMACSLLGPAENLVPNRERAHAGADGPDHAGKVGSLARGERRREALMKTTLANRYLTGVDTGRPYRRQDLVGTGRGILDRAHLEHIDPTVFVESHCLHQASSVIAPTIITCAQTNLASTTGPRRECFTGRLSGDPQAPLATPRGTPAIITLIPGHVPDQGEKSTTMLKRLTHLVVGGSVLGALALGGSAVAAAATAPSGSASTATGALAPARSAAPPASVRGDSAGAVNHVRDGRVHDRYLTDHEHYLRHHQRLTSEA